MGTKRKRDGIGYWILDDDDGDDDGDGNDGRMMRILGTTGPRPEMVAIPAGLGGRGR